MKILILSLALLFGITTSGYASAEKTKVCVDVKDKAGNTVKDAKGNIKQNCKEMKVHKKLEGTEVPVKK
ncbi:MAG: hypothetical protein EBU33_09695 [Sphingobacteriia bacterium]|nr:hypothetical protein [Sphingobacteriia bacterium]